MMVGAPSSQPQPSMTLGDAPSAPAVNATALMALLMNNPQILQALQSMPFSTEPQGVAVNVPNRAPVSIPLNAVMNTIAQLAQASTRELSALSGEDEPDVPDYLLADDGSFIVDPANPQERVALALHWLRVDAEVQRYRSSQTFAPVEASLDESDAWAVEAGFDD